jgi:hypothetical protein
MTPNVTQCQSSRAPSGHELAAGSTLQQRLSKYVHLALARRRARLTAVWGVMWGTVATGLSGSEEPLDRLVATFNDVAEPTAEEP